MSAAPQRAIFAAEADVREAYRWILGRDPDAMGLENYAGMLDRGEIDAGSLRLILTNSDEFRGYETTKVYDVAFRNTTSSEVVFIQTADAGFYKTVLDDTSRTVTEY